MFGRSFVLASTLTLTACTSVNAEDQSRSQQGNPADQQAFLDTCEDWDDWDKPAPPFKVYGNTYYVGTCGITAILVTGKDGHILIDGGTETGAKLVASNIEELGFKLSDVKILTHTQEHHDHVGGLAELKIRTGGKLIASKRAESVFETGILNRDDPQYRGPVIGLAKVIVDESIRDGEAISIGGGNVVAHYTPGHSPGAISWRWRECEGSQCRIIVFSDGLGPFSAEGYRWSDNPEYLADYRASIAWLSTVEADICLSAHPSQMRMLAAIETASLSNFSDCSRAGRFVSERVKIILAEELASE